jgi:hypothetical protein
LTVVLAFEAAKSVAAWAAAVPKVGAELNLEYASAVIHAGLL